MRKVHRRDQSRLGTQIYPGSAPLDGGKDLLPASLLLLFARSRLQGSGSYNSGAGDFSLVLGFLSTGSTCLYWWSFSLLGLIDLGPGPRL